MFVEQVSGDAPQDPRLLLDFKLNPVEEKTETVGEGGNSVLLLVNAQVNISRVLSLINNFPTQLIAFFCKSPVPRT